MKYDGFSRSNFNFFWRRANSARSFRLQARSAARDRESSTVISCCSRRSLRTLSTPVSVDAGTGTGRTRGVGQRRGGALFGAAPRGLRNSSEQASLASRIGDAEAEPEAEYEQARTGTRPPCLWSLTDNTLALPAERGETIRRSGALRSSTGMSPGCRVLLAAAESSRRRSP